MRVDRRNFVLVPDGERDYSDEGISTAELVGALPHEVRRRRNQAEAEPFPYGRRMTLEEREKSIWR